jgi:eukaryotic-like serine/threonine-protein kinase
MCPVSAPDDEVTLDPGLTRAVTIGSAQVTPRPEAFAPGAIIAGRYRLVALLGRGGMGEVYRAEDLTLDQPVALKFLPAAVAAGDTRLSQFHNELRVARQVSHKNVCRLYDLGETNGRRFLTMEYVDGEDLGSLLRRIGRVPHDKAVQIARQLCAGVAAAHDRGVLHRDLKPANVMIDGDGNVRITDFGIATAGGDGGGEFAGTPQYMAPEQFAGKAASIKSDIYALGLTLFEIFTGRRAQESKTFDDLKTFHETGTHTTPSSIVRDLDPTVERLILRCLERDPDRRPASALVVAAALPGADPLAAALAAGETPSPEILAAAGEADALGVAKAIAALATVVVSVLVFATVSARTSLVARVPLDKPPAVLIDRAEQLIASFGYDKTAGDRASDFILAEDYIEWVRETRRTPARWDGLATGNPSAVLFWYRTSPRDMVPLEDSTVSLLDPAVTETDMRAVVLDPQGRLREFRSVPPQQDQAVASPIAPPWDALFDAAGLTLSSFTAVPSEWTPRDYADARAAWKGPLTVSPGIEVRVEAAAYRGKPVFFQVIGPWTRPTFMDPVQRTTADRVMIAVIVTVMALLLSTAMFLARRNLGAGRADRRGAARLAAFIAIAGSVAWVAGAHHVSSVDAEVGSLIRRVGLLAFISALLWMVYVALEPYVRRFWPDGLLGWSRLLAGHIKDPRVGRDLLTGLIVGVTLALSDLARATLIPWLGFVPPRPTYGFLVEILDEPGQLIWAWTYWVLGGIQGALLTVLIVVVLRLALRWNWLSLGVTAIMLSVTSLQFMGGSGGLMYVFPIVNGALLTLVAVRFGLLPLAVTYFAWDVITAVPISLNTSHWAASASNWTLAGLLALTLFGFYASRAGQPLLGSVLKD